jgi:hypothetical protein
MEFVIMILKTLLGQPLILLLPLPLFSSISSVSKVVVKLVLRSEPPHVLTVRYKVSRFALCNKYLPVFLCQVFELLKGVLLPPQKLHKPAIIGPLGIRDDLYN